MGNGKEVGELYAFFLEVSESLICRKIHRDYKINYPGEGMYRDLVQILADGCPDRYKKKITEHMHFTDKQKEHLTPPNEIIDQNKLDFSVYVQIYALIRGSIRSDPIKYLITTRNILCHYPLRPSRIDLQHDWYLMKQHFIKNGIEIQILNLLEQEIRGRLVDTFNR